MKCSGVPIFPRRDFLLIFKFRTAESASATSQPPVEEKSTTARGVIPLGLTQAEESCHLPSVPISELLLVLCSLSSSAQLVPSLRDNIFSLDSWSCPCGTGTPPHLELAFFCGLDSFLLRNSLTSSIPIFTEILQGPPSFSASAFCAVWHLISLYTRRL
jgi:hypothetical protein